MSDSPADVGGGWRRFLPNPWAGRHLLLAAGLLSTVLGIVIAPVALQIDEHRESAASSAATGEVTELYISGGRLKKAGAVVRWTDQTGQTHVTRFQIQTIKQYRVGDRVTVWYDPGRIDHAYVGIAREPYGFVGFAWTLILVGVVGIVVGAVAVVVHRIRSRG